MSVDVAIPAGDNKIEMLGKYLYNAREDEKKWNMKLIVVPIIFGALGKRLKEWEIGGRIETVQPTADRITNVCGNIKDTWYHLITNCF